jgi:quercetin dioxygenase-like cupin family protein
METSKGLIRSSDAVDNVIWNIAGQVYTLKHHSAETMIWHAIFPEGAFVPEHVHNDQDEYLYVLEGEFRFTLDGREGKAVPGDLVSLPKGIAHSYANASDQPAKAVFGVAPARGAYEMFWAVHNLGAGAGPADIALAAAAHGVDFLPPRQGART